MWCALELAALSKTNKVKTGPAGSPPAQREGMEALLKPDGAGGGAPPSARRAADPGAAPPRRTVQALAPAAPGDGR